MSTPEDIIKQLEAMGLDSAQIATVFDDIEQNKRPWYKRLWSKGTHQVQHLRAEAQETKQLAALLKKGSKNLSPEEQAEVRAQLWDLFKVLPAGLIAGGNAILPIPGTSVFTPLLLAKAGLLPSRWREARILHQLQMEERRLREMGQDALANQLHEITEQVEHNADLRAHQANDILHHWDANGNGQWDEEEIADYNQVCQITKERLVSEAHCANWFIQQNDLIFGPTEAKNLSACADHAWIRHYPSEEEATKWVRLSDVLPLETGDDSTPRPSHP